MIVLIPGGFNATLLGQLRSNPALSVPVSLMTVQHSAGPE